MNLEDKINSFCADIFCTLKSQTVIVFVKDSTGKNLIAAYSDGKRNSCAQEIMDCADQLKGEIDTRFTLVPHLYKEVPDEPSGG